MSFNPQFIELKIQHDAGALGRLIVHNRTALIVYASQVSAEHKFAVSDLLNHLVRASCAQLYLGVNPTFIEPNSNRDKKLNNARVVSMAFLNEEHQTVFKQWLFKTGNDKLIDAHWHADKQAAYARDWRDL